MQPENMVKLKEIFEAMTTQQRHRGMTLYVAIITTILTLESSVLGYVLKGIYDDTKATLKSVTTKTEEIEKSQSVQIQWNTDIERRITKLEK